MDERLRLVRSVLAAVAVLAAFLPIAACSGGQSESADFEGGPGMLYFYSPDCPVCQSMRPIMDDLEDEYGGAFRFVRVNVETERGKGQARAFGLIGQPAYLFFDSSDAEVRRLMGAHSRATLAQAIEQALGED